MNFFQPGSGKGSELLGIRKYDFIRMLADEGIDYFDYSDLELEEEFKIIDQWEKDIRFKVLEKAGE